MKTVTPQAVNLATMDSFVILRAYTRRPKVIPAVLPRTGRAVYNLWYTFVSTFSGNTGDKSTSAMAATTSSPVAFAEPRRDTSRSRLPVFLRLNKGGRAPPLNLRSRRSSTLGEYIRNYHFFGYGYEVVA